MTTPGPYQSSAAFRAAAESRLKNQVKQVAGRTFPQLKREFVYQRFLARLWTPDIDPPLWVLKGGVGLLARLPGARSSRDIDLLNLAADVDAAVAEIRDAGQRNLGDYLRFEVKRTTTMSVDDALQVSIDAYLGVRVWESFTVDISLERHYVAELEQLTPLPVVDLAGLPPLPTYHLYPIADQVADKVSAMYEVHGAGYPSNRYRDLVDLVLIINDQELDAATLIAALRARQQNARNHIELPTSMQVPGQGWATGYLETASTSPLSPAMHNLDTAIAHVGDCLNPILSETLDRGGWNPAEHRWDLNATVPD